MILYSASDLVWATRIKTTAEDLGLACRPVRSETMLRDRLADSDVRAVLLDLEAPDRAWDLIGMLRGPEAEPGTDAVTVIAWGPHVAVDLFARARSLGADEVLTRGAFSSGLPGLLVRLSGDAARLG